VSAVPAAEILLRTDVLLLRVLRSGRSRVCVTGVSQALPAATCSRSLLPPCRASCSAEPCCQTSAIVVCFAVFLSLGAAGLCVFWAWTDRVHKAKLAADKKSLEDSIAAETAKAAQIAGGGISTVAGAASGYSAL